MKVNSSCRFKKSKPKVLHFTFVICFELKYNFFCLLCFSGSTDPRTKKTHVRCHKQPDEGR